MKKPTFGWSRLLGYDVFISYRHGEAERYARGLKAALSAQPYELACFIDADDTPGGDLLAPEIATALKASRLLVVVVTSGIAESDWIPKEVEAFKTTDRPVVPVNIDGMLDHSPEPIFQNLREYSWLNDSRDALGAGTPSTAVLDQISKACTRTLVRTLSRAIVASVIVTLAAIAAVALWNWRQAAAERDRATQEALRVRTHGLALSADFARSESPELAALLLQALPTRSLGDRTQALSTARRVASTPIPQAVLRGHTGEVLSAEFDHTGRRLLSVSGDGTARLWDPTTGSSVATLVDDEPIAAGRFAGESVVTATEAGRLTWWNLEGEKERTQHAAAKPQRSDQIWIADGGSRLFYLPDARHARVKNLDLQGAEVELESPADVSRLALSPDGRLLLGWSGSGPVVWWTQLESPGRVVSDYWANWIAFAKNSNLVAAGGPTGVQVWRADGTSIANIVEEREIVVGQILRALSFSPDASFLLSSSQEGAIRARRVEPELRAAYTWPNRSAVSRLVFSPDGLRFATSGNDPRPHIWTWQDPSDANPLQVAPVVLPHAANAAVLAWSSDSQQVVTASAATLRIWPTQGAPDPVVLSSPSTYRPGHSSFSRDGLRVAAVQGDVAIWSSDGKLLHRIEIPGVGVRRVAWGPDGKTMAAATFNHAVYLLSPTGEWPPRVVGQHKDSIESISMTRDGRKDPDRVSRRLGATVDRGRVQAGGQHVALGTAQFGGAIERRQPRRDHRCRRLGSLLESKRYGELPLGEHRCGQCALVAVSWPDRRRSVQLIKHASGNSRCHGCRPRPGNGRRKDQNRDRCGTRAIGGRLLWAGR